MNKSTSLTAIILTYNEERHLERCIESLIGVCSDIVVIDSFSVDNTEKIARKYKARFFQNTFVNYATQLNWGIVNTNINSNWIIRIDADEYISEKLALDIKANLMHVRPEVNGLLVKRMMYFMNKPLKKAGMYPIWHLRIWRIGTAICEERWMDERMKLHSGEISKLNGDLIDHNLNNLTWWTGKHNNYATREMIDFLNGIYNFSDSHQLQANVFGSAEQRRRSLKLAYLKLPLFIRPFIFFSFRYFFQLGFLEGKRGFIWNVLQCGWYRFLVDAKIDETFRLAGRDKQNIKKFIKDQYGYEV